MIHLTGIAKIQGNRVLFRNGSVQINEGERIGLVGPNGAGKSTIFRLIVGEETPDEGTVSVASKCVIGYFSQETGDMRGRTALAEVMAGAGRVSVLAAEIATMEKQLEQSALEPISDDELAALVEKFGEAQEEFQARGGYDLEARSQAILTGLGIGPRDYNRPTESFSGGWKMRIALAKILALNPDVLLMDEPTNHLDIESIVWLEEWIRTFKGAVLMTSHDKIFLNRLVKEIVEIAGGSVNHYGGDYDYYLRERDIRRKQLVASFERQQEMLAKEEEFIARFAARASHAAQVQSRVKKLDKIERIELPPEQQVAKFEFRAGARSGNEVVIMQNAAKVWDREDGELIKVFSGVDITVQRLQKVAVTGVNGAGKSTLLKCITGHATPTSGVIKLGASVKMGYFSQHALDVLDARRTLQEEMQVKLPDASLGFVRNLLGAFLFSGDDVEKKVGVLSGGEKSRLVLATILAQSPNFLVLDEPTNHLDIESLEVLLAAVQEFEGTVMVVSHDRHFLKSTVNRVFELDRGGMQVYEGDYEYYLSKKEPV